MRITKFIAKYWIFACALITVLFLFIPNVIILIFSFNDGGRYNYKLSHFTLDSWRNICAPAGLCQSLGTSLSIGVLATLISTTIGTLLAFALVKYTFPGDGIINRLVFLPLATPDVVLAASLLALFINLGIPLGFTTVLIAHVSFMLSYVVSTVKARIQGNNNVLEQAAMDLYASPWQVFYRITLPQIAPGVASAAVLAFALSFDDFIVTNFNAGAVITFPVYVWTAAGRGVPAQVNVIGSIFFLTIMISVSVWGIFSQLQHNKIQRRKMRSLHHIKQRSS